MAYDHHRNRKYHLEVQSHSHASGYYSGHHGHHHSHHSTDENRNNNCSSSKRISHQSSGTQTIQKVDAATMTDPLQIDFRLTSEYLARCSTTLGIPYVPKYEDSANSSSHHCQDLRTKQNNYNVEPPRTNGVQSFHCPECPYRFDDREALYEHIEDHRQRPHICDICGASLKRKEHLDRHKQGHNKDRPYSCNMCCKAFKRNEHLARHMVIHSGSKNQVCTECGKAFYRKDHLKKHLLSHSGGGSHKSKSDGQGSDNGNSDEGVSFALMMRQAGPPPFSSIRS